MILLLPNISAQTLELSVGKEVYAVVKASNVMIATD